MPDGYSAPSRAAALGSIGAGLMDVYFPALKQQRDQDEADKRYEKELQMRALHDLIASGNTTVGDVPKLMKMHADLAGIGKLPGVQEIITNMEQAAQAQVPYGDEQETGQSQVARGQAAMSAANEQNRAPTPIATSIAMRPVPPEPSAPVTVQPGAPGQPTQTILPATYQTDQSVAPTFTAPALKVVPPEPVMYQPTRTAAGLTQDEYRELREGRIYDARQESMLRRQSQLAEEAGDRQAKRDADRQLAQITQIRTKAEEARKTQDQLFENKIKMLEPEMKARAGLRKAQIAVAIAAQNPGMDPTEVDKRAGDMAFAEIQVGVDAKKAQIEKSKAEIVHWRNQDARALVAKGGAAVAGLTAAEAREFRIRTLELMPDLNSTRSQLQKLQSDLALIGGKDPAIEQRIKDLSDRQDQLLLQLKTERDNLLNNRQSAPTQSAPSQQRGTYNVPLGKYGLQ